MLGYFVGDKDAIRTMGGKLLSEDTVAQNPSGIPTTCLHENV